VKPFRVALPFAVLLLCLDSGATARTAPNEPLEITRGPRGHARIALTFDAGGEADCFNDLIKALAHARVASTFFITGKWAYENPECAREITRQGHEIGNHTWHHIDLTRQSDAVVRDEILSTEIFLADLCRQNPRPLLRAPFGARDARVRRLAHALGYRSIYWTLDSLDSVEPPKSAEFLTHRITSRSDEQLDGAIILMHVGERSTADALPAIIANLQSRGFQLVTISTLLRE
jgi:peptidoglycan/xylan/chitin deacetylase (PgdA/CDA1 family)